MIIHLVNAEFVAVWINVRTTPIPKLPCLAKVLGEVQVNAEGFVQGDFNQGFFVRSVVLASDGKTLLNTESGDAPMAKMFAEGHFPYAWVKASDYLVMLHKSLARLPN